MAKRKKLKNVKISEQELTPTVIGYLNDKKGSPLFLIVFFGILLAFLWYIPEITTKVNLWLGKEVETTSTPTTEEPEVFEQNDVGKQMDYAADLQLVFNEITISDISVNNGTLRLSAKNNSKKMIDFEKNKYYIYLSDSNDNLIDILPISENLKIMQGQEERTVKFNLKSSNELAKLVVDVYKEDYLPDVNIVEGILTCSKGTDSYAYKFEDNKLIMAKYNYVNENVSFMESDDFSYRAEQYESVKGVEASVSENEGVFYYFVEYDLSVVKKDEIQEELIFEKDTTLKHVNFNMTQEGYTCN